MKECVLVAGARPNFMKIAPLMRALQARGVVTCLVHTGQHYDAKMSDIFFSELRIPEPDVHLGVGSGARVDQTRAIAHGLGDVLRQRRVDAIVVVGDVTSTVGGAIAGVLAGVPVIHIEAGLRSFHLGMPEEVNRILVDHYSDRLFTTEPIAANHLQAEGIDPAKIHYVGNVMIDTLRTHEAEADAREIVASLGLSPKTYGLLTLHRPDTVDHKEVFCDVWETLTRVSEQYPLVMPMHHRTRARMQQFGIQVPATIRLIEPLGYLDVLQLMKRAALVLTDSGGIQEETTALGVPCLTLRRETERPITIDEGTNELLGVDRERILDAVDRVRRGVWKRGRIPDLWDGHAAERIADILLGL